MAGEAVNVPELAVEAWVVLVDKVILDVTLLTSPSDSSSFILLMAFF